MILKKRKSAQLKLSFGMIFSIFLIIIFLAFAFYAIKFLLNMQKSIKIGEFIKNLQEDIDKMQKGSSGSQKNEYVLNKKVDYICFIDYDSPKRGINRNLYDELQQLFFKDENLFFYPIGSGEGIDKVKIKNIDLIKITKNENPFCINCFEGKVDLIIKKEYGDRFVEISN
jgi:hypothetical protein